MKGQVFTLDLLFGLLITITALLSVVLFLPTQEAPFTDDAQRIQILMTEGVPANWTADDVIIPGFLSNSRFNETKIEAFESLPLPEQKQLLGITSDFSITFTVNEQQLPLCAGCGAEPASYKELLPLERYSILNGNITRMEMRLYR